MGTRYINDWTCPSCGELQSKHNQCLGDKGVCEICFVNSLTVQEENYIAEIKASFKKQNGLNKISGGFCTVTPQFFDEDTIFCRVLLGSTDDTGRYVDEFDIEIDRKNLTFEVK